MEQLDIPTADKTRREAELLGDLGPIPLSIGKVKTQFIPEDSSSTPSSYVDYVAPKKIHVDSSISKNFPARSADSYFCSWEEKGKHRRIYEGGWGVHGHP
uniref:Uncharacterized protein n=1 Tax=Opuntia streptacantha TaxID=393608 RepID=A0A7C8Z5P9_OPUST